jgi:ectoine hydroxylase-related dioxygenase (phytanoyl-CoA dioxygenase family)
MADMITQQNLDQYVAEGATLVSKAFDANWVTKLTTAVQDVWAILAAGETLETIWPRGVQNPPSMGTTIYGGVELRNCAPCHPLMRDWVENSPAAELAAQITGASSMRFWMDSTFIKEPETGEAATPWHTDGCTYPFRGEQLPTMWVALTDVDDDNAPLMTIAESHRIPERFHSSLSRQDITLPGYRPWQDLLDICAAPGDKLRVWHARAGDMLIFHPQMIHGSKARSPESPGRRIGFSTRWIGSDAIWQPDAYAAKIPILLENPALTVGNPPPESVFPIIWPQT